MSKFMKITIVLVFTLLLLLSVYLVNRTNRCLKGGLARNEALIFADKKLKTQFKANPLLNDFILVKEQFESDKSWWIFTYQAKGCVVAIIIDECGTSDVGGLSGGCR